MEGMATFHTHFRPLSFEKFRKFLRFFAEDMEAMLEGYPPFAGPEGERHLPNSPWFYDDREGYKDTPRAGGKRAAQNRNMDTIFTTLEHMPMEKILQLQAELEGLGLWEYVLEVLPGVRAQIENKRLIEAEAAAEELKRERMLEKECLRAKILRDKAKARQKQIQDANAAQRQALAREEFERQRQEREVKAQAMRDALQQARERKLVEGMRHLFETVEARFTALSRPTRGRIPGSGRSVGSSEGEKVLHVQLLARRAIRNARIRIPPDRDQALWEILSLQGYLTSSVKQVLAPRFKMLQDKAADDLDK